MKIFVECYSDKKLVEVLGVKRTSVNHSRSKGEVVKSVLKTPDSIGIIDEDPNSSQPSMLNDFIPNASFTNMNLTVHKNQRDRKIIIIKPRLEEWLYSVARKNNIFPEDYDLPNDGKELHKMPHYEKDRKFQEFLDSLAHSKEFNQLKNWIF